MLDFSREELITIKNCVDMAMGYIDEEEDPHITSVIRKVKQELAEQTYSTGIENPCADGKCTDPEVHAASGHDI